MDTRHWNGASRPRSVASQIPRLGEMGRVPKSNRSSSVVARPGYPQCMPCLDQPGSFVCGVFGNVVAWLIGLVTVAVVIVVSRKVLGPSPQLAIEGSPNAGTASGVDWSHLYVHNRGVRWANRRFSWRTRAAPSAVAYGILDGRPIRFVWATNRGPVERRSVFFGMPSPIPIAVRDNQKASWRGRRMQYWWILALHTYYVTDEIFLTQGNTRHPQPARWRLDPGAHQLEITVQGEDGSRVTEWFELNVPAYPQVLKILRRS